MTSCATRLRCVPVGTAAREHCLGGALVSDCQKTPAPAAASPWRGGDAQRVDAGGCPPCSLPPPQVAKKKARVKRQAEVAKAYEQGVLPPPRAVPKVRRRLAMAPPHARSSPVPVPQTIDNTREADPTIVQPDDEEALAGVAEDEFAAHFARDVEPSLLVTTSRKPSGRIFEFLSNLFETLPNATYYARKAYPVSRRHDGAVLFALLGSRAGRR